MLPILKARSRTMPHGNAAGKAGSIDPASEPLVSALDQRRELLLQRGESISDRPCGTLDLFEPLADITHEHLGEESQLLWSQIIAALPLVDRGK